MSNQKYSLPKIKSLPVTVFLSIFLLLPEKNSVAIEKANVLNFTFGKLYHSALHSGTKFAISPILRHYLQPSCNVICNPFLQFKIIISQFELHVQVEVIGKEH